MQKQTIKQLNQLNKNFYQNVADDFSDSRQYFWAGWGKIIAHLKKISQNKKKIKVLDIGCGNARFAQFLQSQKINYTYFGLDNSTKLLEIAQKTLNTNHINNQLVQFDLVENLLKKQKIVWPFFHKFDLIVAFGLTHHLPGSNLRLNFFQSLAKILNKDGLLIISNWQFVTDERFKKNILTWQEIKTHSQLKFLQKIKLKNLLKKLEHNDFLLDWRKQDKSNPQELAIRYCHFLDKKTSEKLVKKSGYTIIDQFYADGKSQKLNHYFVLKKAD